MHRLPARDLFAPGECPEMVKAEIVWPPLCADAPEEYLEVNPREGIA